MNREDEKIIKSYFKSNDLICESKTELYSILIPLIFSKSFFKRGSEVQLFLKKELNISLADYVFRSRSIIVGRLIQTINNLSLEDSVELNKIASSKISLIIKANFHENMDFKSDKTTSKKQSKTKSHFMMWNEYIENNNL